MASRFGDLVRKVGSLKPLALNGLLPGALVCGLVVSSLTMANASPLSDQEREQTRQQTIEREAQIERDMVPGPRMSFTQMKDELDLVAMNYYGGALATMAKADLSRMTPEVAMRTLAAMAKSTLASGPSRGDLVEGPSGVAGLDAALGFFSKIDADATPQSVQARALEIATSAGVDLSTFKFDGILKELQKANEYKVTTLNEIAEVIYDQRGTSISDIVEKALEGQFERHATQKELLDQVAWAEMLSASLPAEELDRVIAQVNAKTALDGALGAIVQTWEREGSWTARESLAKIVNTGLASAEKFVEPAASAPKP